MIEQFRLRIGPAFLASLAFGLERRLTNTPIGFDTDIFVCTGSCGLAMAAKAINPENPRPLLGAIVTGLGFLGAGARLKTGDRIYGFNSAAGIWVFAILGVMLGNVYFSLSIALYSPVWLVVLIDRAMETKGFGAYERRLTLRMVRYVPRGELEPRLGTERFKTIHEDLDKTTSVHNKVLLVSERRASFEDPVGRPAKDEDFLLVRLESPRRPVGSRAPGGPALGLPVRSPELPSRASPRRRAPTASKSDEPRRDSGALVDRRPGCLRRESRESSRIRAMSRVRGSSWRFARLRPPTRYALRYFASCSLTQARSSPL